MKLIQRDGEDFVFHISKREKRLLLELLNLYPLIPTAHHRVSRTASAKELGECQKLLEEALAERKRENKRQLVAMLNQERRFKEADGGYRLALGTVQMDWLLQVLNEIRVGSWVILGEPDEKQGKPVKPTTESLRHYAAMEFCGRFQMTLLDAFEGQK